MPDGRVDVREDIEHIDESGRIKNIADTLETTGYIRRIRYIDQGKHVFDWEVYDEKQHVENQDVEIQMSDAVSATGSRVSFGGASVIIAAQVTKDDA